MPERERPAFREVYRTVKTHVLVGGRGVPVHPHEGEVVGLGADHLDGDGVGFTGADVGGHVEDESPESPDYLVGACDERSVDP